MTGSSICTNCARWLETMTRRDGATSDDSATTPANPDLVPHFLLTFRLGRDDGIVHDMALNLQRPMATPTFTQGEFFIQARVAGRAQSAGAAEVDPVVAQRGKRLVLRAVPFILRTWSQGQPFVTLGSSVLVLGPCVHFGSCKCPHEKS